MVDNHTVTEDERKGVTTGDVHINKSTDRAAWGNVTNKDRVGMQTEGGRERQEGEGGGVSTEKVTLLKMSPCISTSLWQCAHKCQRPEYYRLNNLAI